MDLNFVPALDVGARVYTVTLQSDGKIVIGGLFTTHGDVSATNVARLNQDGSSDPTFNPGAAADNGYVSALAVQADGKIIVGGYFSSSSGIAQANLTRLNPDGTVDTGFDPDLYVDGQVNSVVVQDDGRILLGGGFSIVDFLLRRSIARLNGDGSLDATFDACVAAGAGSGATSLALPGDGKILASGQFTFSSGDFRDGIARLNPCGDLDPSYAKPPGVNTDATVFTIALRDGQALLGGNFKLFHLEQRAGVALLTGGGKVEANFRPTPGVDFWGTVYALVPLPNSQVIVAGLYTQYNGITRAGLARVNSDGSLDPTFDPGLGPNNAVSSLALQPDGQLLVAGNFSSFDGVPRNGLARLKLAPTPFHLGTPNRLMNGQWQLTLYGESQTRYAIEASSDAVN